MNMHEGKGSWPNLRARMRKCEMYQNHVNLSLTPPFIASVKGSDEGEASLARRSCFNIELLFDITICRDMRFPTMWHFDKCRLGRACATSC